MKKLLTVMAGLSFLTATIGVCFAQDTVKKEATQKKKTGKKSKANKTNTEKK